MKKLILILIPYLVLTSIVHAQNPTLWGMTYFGGTNGNHNAGIIFQYDIVSGKETVMHNFGSGSDGYNPDGSLIRASNGLLYGMASGGGVRHDPYARDGIIFSYDIATGAYHDLHDFGSGTDGYRPFGSLLQASNGLLYGMTYFGGANLGGIIFSYDISTGNYTDLHDFGSGIDGYNPLGSLIEADNGLLYGMTPSGGANQRGIIFSYDISTGKETDLHDFGSAGDGGVSGVSLMQGSNGILYGMTPFGGANGYGTIFECDISSNSYSDLHDFGNGTGRSPAGPLLQANNGLLYGMTYEGGSGRAGIIFSYNISTEKRTSVYHFTYPGGHPAGSLIQTSSGLLYGTSPYSGINGVGTIFSYNISTKNWIDIYDFNALGTDGWDPIGDLLEVDDTFATGISPLAKTIDNIRLYPNPSSTTINLSLKLPQEQRINLSLFNTLGQQVWAKDLGKTKQIETTIPVMNLANGVYVLKVNSGSSWQEKEVVIAR